LIKLFFQKMAYRRETSRSMMLVVVMLAVGLGWVQGAPESQKLMAETQAPQLNGGLRVESDGFGHGEAAKNGETLHIHYKGALTNGGVIFDEGTFESCLSTPPSF
jgi:hypothetical protein